MSKKQFWTLNLVGSLCALLILSTIVLGEVNGQLNERAMGLQSQFNQAQQVRGTAQNLVSRIFQIAPKEPALQQLLERHQIKYTPPEPAGTKPAP